MGSELVRRDSALATLQTLEEAGILSETSFDLPSADLTFEQYEMIGRWLGKVRDTSAWWLADWINAGEALFGEKYSQALEATSRSLRTLQNYAWVGSNVPPSIRRADLSFSHHAEVAKLAGNEQRHWLARAVAEGWGVEHLRGELRENGHGPAEKPAWSEREAAERDKAQRAVLAEVAELADAPAERIAEVAGRARDVLNAAPGLPDVGKRTVTCPACAHAFEED